MKRAALLLACAAACQSRPPPHQMQTFHVSIKGMQFVPPSLDVQVGDLVVWTNDDFVPHTVTAPGWFDSGGLQPHQQWSHAVEHRGEIAYGCTFHPLMKAKLEAN